MIFSAVTKIIERRERAVAKVDAAIRSGRLLSAQREWAVEYCTRYPAGFQTFIAAAPVYESNGNGTVTAVPANPTGLNKTELMVSQRMGITAEQFAASKQKRGWRPGHFEDHGDVVIPVRSKA